MRHEFQNYRITELQKVIIIQLVWSLNMDCLCNVLHFYPEQIMGKFQYHSLSSYYNVGIGQPMGNNQSFGSDPTLTSKQVDFQADFKIYESATGQQFEKYIVTHDGSSTFEQNYQFRLENKHEDLVDVIYAGPVQSFMACTQRSNYEVVTERIPYRLETLSALQARNSIVILNAALRGFRAVFQKHAGIDIKQSMIGINTENRVKVWFNPNFAINRPEENSIDAQKLSSKEQESQMVHRIFDLVDSKTEKDQLWSELINAKSAANPESFNQALALLQSFQNARMLSIGNTVYNIFNKNYYKENQIELSLQKVNSQPLISQQNHHSVRVDSVNLDLRKPFQEIQSKYVAQAVPNHPYSNNMVEVNLPKVLTRKANSIMMEQSRFTNPIPILHQPSDSNSMRFSIHNSNPKPIQITFNKQNIPTTVPIFSSQFNKNSMQFKPIGIDEPQPHPQSVDQIVVNEAVHVQTPKLPTISSESISVPPSAEAQKAKQQPDNAPTFSAIPQQNVQNLTINAPQLEQDEFQSNNLQQQPKIIENNSFEAEKEQIFINPKIMQQAITIEPSYQINVYEISSEQSLHEQLTPLLLDEEGSNHRGTIIEALQLEGKTAQNVYEPNHPQPIQYLQTMKTALNPSLVDTRQIKQQQDSSQLSNPQQQKIQPVIFQRKEKNVNLSYKQMRRLLLEQLQD